jgi:predicted enzyme related to lactoylglutathione lyase
MTNRPVAPSGVPCWVDLWTSDVVLGGAVLTEAAGHGLGRVALVADPVGTRFWLFGPKG